MAIRMDTAECGVLRIENGPKLGAAEALTSPSSFALDCLAI